MRKILTTSLLILLISLSGICQVVKTTDSKSFWLGVSFSPDYCFRYLKGDASSQSTIHFRDSMEYAKFGFTTGLIIIYDLNQKIKIETGLLFSDKGERSKKYRNIISTGPPDQPYPINVYFINHYQYIDIPVKITYNIIGSKSTIFISSGISSNLFFKDRSKGFMEMSDGSIRKRGGDSLIGVKQLNFSLLAGIGLDYNIKNRFKIRIEPIYRYSFTPSNNKQPKSFLYSFGTNLGIFYNY